MRSFGIGVQWLFIRALGSIPGPILFGVIIDLTCVLWQIRECDKTQGSCWIYESTDMAKNAIAMSKSPKFNTIVVCTYQVALAMKSKQTLQSCEDESI